MQAMHYLTTVIYSTHRYHMEHGVACRYLMICCHLGEFAQPPVGTEMVTGLTQPPLTLVYNIVIFHTVCDKYIRTSYVQMTHQGKLCA